MRPATTTSYPLDFTQNVLLAVHFGLPTTQSFTSRLHIYIPVNKISRIIGLKQN